MFFSYNRNEKIIEQRKMIAYFQSCRLFEIILTKANGQILVGLLRIYLKEVHTVKLVVTTNFALFLEHT